MLKRSLSVSLTQMIDQALKPFADQPRGSFDEISAKILTFLKNRISRLLADEGFSKDVIAAVLSTNADSVPDI